MGLTKRLQAFCRDMSGAAKHVVGAAAVAAIPVAVVNYTFPRLTVSEGLALVSYYDPWGKVWTDCIGNTENVVPGQRKTREQCLQETAARLPDYWWPMVKAAPILGTDAVSTSFKSSWLQFTWNEGTGTFARYVAPPMNRATSPQEVLATCELMFHFTRAGNNATLLLSRRKREYADCVRNI